MKRNYYLFIKSLFSYYACIESQQKICYGAIYCKIFVKYLNWLKSTQLRFKVAMNIKHGYEIFVIHLTGKILSPFLRVSCGTVQIHAMDLRKILRIRTNYITFLPEEGWLLSGPCSLYPISWPQKRSGHPGDSPQISKKEIPRRSVWPNEVDGH